MANQFGRPISDISTGAWTTTPLYAKIGETTYSDTDYVQSKSFKDLNAGSTDVFEVKLTTLSTPNAGTHTIRFRAKYTEGTDLGITCALVQGSTVIASYTPTLSSSFQTLSFTLTSDEIANITDYTDLRLRFTATNSAKTATARYVQVSWSEIEIPGAPVTLASTVTVAVSQTSALVVSYGLFANPNVVTTISIPSTEYAYTPVTPLSKITWPNAVVQSSMYNSEIERIYEILSSLKCGELTYANHFRIGYDETLDALVIYYNEIPIMRLDSNGNLEIAGTLYENVL